MTSVLLGRCHRWSRKYVPFRSTSDLPRFLLSSMLFIFSFLYLPSLIIVCLLLYVVVFIIKLLTATEYLCHKWQRVCSVYRNLYHVFPHSRLFSALLPNVTQRMPLVEQELLTRHEYTRSWWSISSFMCGILL